MHSLSSSTPVPFLSWEGLSFIPYLFVFGNKSLLSYEVPVLVGNDWYLSRYQNYFEILLGIDDRPVDTKVEEDQRPP